MKLRMVQMFFNAYKEERNLLHWVMKESSFLADSIVLGLWKETFFDCSKKTLFVKTAIFAKMCVILEIISRIWMYHFREITLT